MYTLEELARHVGASLAGDPRTRISGVRPFEQARPGDLTLAEKGRFLRQLDACPAAAVVVPQGFQCEGANLLLSNRPKVAFARILQLFHHQPFEAGGISPLASIGQDCRISDQVTIHPFAAIGDGVRIEEGVTIQAGVCVGDSCRIGRDCTLYANATLYDRVTLGQRVIVHSGAVIGADGFGFVFDGERQLKVPQTGTVLVGDDVEIGANSCVDRATFGQTVIEESVKLDNHVHIGHNCRIGANTVIVAQVGISGTVDVGRNCTFAGHSGAVDHVRIGDGATVMMKTAISKDVPPGATVSGQPAMDHRRHMRLQALIRRLPRLYRSVRHGDSGDESE